MCVTAKKTCAISVGQLISELTDIALLAKEESSQASTLQPSAQTGLLTLSVGLPEHEFKAAAESFFCALSTPFATCPMTQTGFVRVLAQIDPALALTDGVAVLASICAHPNHRFIADDLSALELPWTAIRGHRQITDAYLAALARKHGAKLATFDHALAAVHPDVVVLP